MNFSNLKYFLTAAEEMNFTKASHRLHISQQALSNHITKLEHELGTELFERGKSLSLTYAGHRLVETSNQILDLHNQFLAEVNDISGNIRGELTIGITHTRGQALLPLLLPEFHKEHPYINVKIEEANARELEESLQHGFVDLVLGFTPFFTVDAQVTEISPDRLFLVVPVSIMEDLYKEDCEKMREKFHETVDISAFKEQPFILLKKGDRIRTILDSYFKKQHINPHILLETSNIQTAFALSQRGMGICVYPEMFLRGATTLSASMMDTQHVDFYPLQSSTTTEQLAIAYNKDRYLSEAAKDFIALSQRILG
ncbi:MAG: LysR family transcriptional regulator [Lachnospiraceae bacterium]|nr:LysR family transcriptional regulator [Lachnospiraceae bacterium]